MRQVLNWRQSVNYLLRKGKKIEEEEKKQKRVKIDQEIDVGFINIHTSENGTPQRDQTPLRRTRDAYVRKGEAAQHQYRQFTDRHER